MLSITAIVLAYNEEIHIGRCIESLKPVVRKIYVIDSFSNDRTVEIAQLLGADVKQRKWRNYADQFQWGIDNLNIDTPWLMRIDADEYLEHELQDELCSFPKIPEDVVGFYINRKVYFQDQWIRYGGFYPHFVLRIWRTGKGRIEQRWMDEHIILLPNAKTIKLKGRLVDDNLKGITFWINKHNGYASREAIDLLNEKYHLFEKDEGIIQMDNHQAKWKRIIKDLIYTRLPLGSRTFLYFVYRYFFLLGFLDGKKGFFWHFMQGFWYRLLVDIKIIEIEKRSQGDISKMRNMLMREHHINL